VATENLGTYSGLLAAAALMLDYVLVVAVGISAGVGALVSAAPRLQPDTLPICLAILLLITIVNLRGVREAGVAFMIPTSPIRAFGHEQLGLGWAGEGAAITLPSSVNSNSRPGNVLSPRNSTGFGPGVMHSELGAPIASVRRSPVGVLPFDGPGARSGRNVHREHPQERAVGVEHLNAMVAPVADVDVVADRWRWRAAC